MLLDPAEAADVIARYDNDPVRPTSGPPGNWARRAAFPYVVGRERCRRSGRLIFNAVGGVEWTGLPTAQRDEVKAALRQADWASVRDHVTQGALRAEGIDVPLCPDPAVMVAEWFGETDPRASAAGCGEGHAGRLSPRLSGMPVQRGFWR